MIRGLLALVLAFGLGSLPWSYWVGRWNKVDIRRQGSGNLGATNVYRVLGWRWGALTLVLDAGKGVAAVAVGRGLASSLAGGSMPALAGLAAVVGHMFTPFAGFHGGKGVATGLGVFLGLAPTAAGLGFLVWGATLALTGWVSVSSAVAAIALPWFVVATRDALGRRYPWVLALAFVTVVLILVRHRANWKRVAAGREQAIWERRHETPERSEE